MSLLRWQADRTNTLTELRPLPKEFAKAGRTRGSVEPGFEAGRIHLQSALNVYSRRRQILNCFSKDGDVHDAVTDFTMCRYNFCWPLRTLRVKDNNGRWQPRSPVLAAGLAHHVWSLSEWLTFPAVQRE